MFIIIVPVICKFCFLPETFTLVKLSSNLGSYLGNIFLRFYSLWRGVVVNGFEEKTFASLPDCWCCCQWKLNSRATSSLCAKTGQFTFLYLKTTFDGCNGHVTFVINVKLMSLWSGEPRLSSISISIEHLGLSVNIACKPRLTLSALGFLAYVKPKQLMMQ